MVIHYTLENLTFGAPWLLEHQNHYYAFCSIEADFSFWVDTELMLQVSCWNIGELATQLAEWLGAGLPGDFHYYCIDAEEEDLFTFRQQENGFLFFSAWGIANTPRLVTREALTAFITQYRDDVRSRISNDLHYDSSLYLGQ